MRARGLAVVCVLGAGCGSSSGSITLAPVIDLPATATDDTFAMGHGLTSIQLSVAQAGSSEELASRTFTPGEALELPGVPFGDALVIHMVGLQGNTVVAYGRTCAFDLTNSSLPDPIPHLFFSSTSQFAQLNLEDPDERRGGFAVSNGGTAVIAGGVQTMRDTNNNVFDAPVTSVQQFDPNIDALATLATVGAHAEGAMAILLAGDATNPTPKNVVLGGATSDAQLVEFVSSQGVDHTTQMSLGRAELTATSLVDGRVLAVGGATGGASVAGMTNAASGEIDEIDTDQTVHKANASLVVPRSRHSATRLGDDTGAPVLISGGINAAGSPIAQAELYKPLLDQLGTPSATAMLATPRYNHYSMLLPDESILVFGGLDSLGKAVYSIERFALDTGFTPVSSSLQPPGDSNTNLPGVIDATATTLPDGRILYTGGRNAADGTPLNSAFILSLNSNTGAIDVVATLPMAVARAGHQAALLCDGTVLITGGTQTPQPMERYNPPEAGRR